MSSPWRLLGYALGEIGGGIKDAIAARRRRRADKAEPEPVVPPGPQWAWVERTPNGVFCLVRRADGMALGPDGDWGSTDDAMTWISRWDASQKLLQLAQEGRALVLGKA